MLRLFDFILINRPVWFCPQHFDAHEQEENSACDAHAGNRNPEHFEDILAGYG